MKFSISNIAWDKDQDGLIIDLLKKNNINCIDVAPTLIVDSIEKDYKSQLDNFMKNWNNFSIVAMQSLFYEKKDISFFQSEKTVEESVHYFAKLAELANHLSIKILIFGSPQQRKINYTKDSESLIHLFFKSISDICVAKNLLFCIEPNSEKFNTNFLTTTREAALFIEKHQLQNFMMNFDTGCVLMNNEDVIETFTNYFEFIGHIHISMPFLKPIDEKFIDHKLFCNLINKKNYTGNLSVEMLKDQNNKNINCQNVELACKILKENYMDL